MLGNPHRTRALSGTEAMARPWLKRCLPRNVFEALTFWMRLGYWPNLRHPGTFNEKISCRKLHEVPFAHPNLVDKLAVREFVAACVGAQYLTRILRVFDAPSDVRLRDLPTAFALKCNTGSGMNLLVRDASRVSERSLVAAGSRWVSRPYSTLSHSYECIYDGVAAKVFAEELLEPFESVREYKVWCFDGRPEFIQTCWREDKRRVYRLFDCDWIPCPFGVFNDPDPTPLEGPACLEEMLRLAACLSSEFDFARIDLNVTAGSRITFGEITFHPGGGRARFFPAHYDAVYGVRIPLLSARRSPAGGPRDLRPYAEEAAADV
jgi:hypothetical protein